MKRIILFAMIAVAAVSCCGVSVEKLTVVPYPQEVVLEKGTFDVAGADIRCVGQVSEDVVALAERFAAQTALVSGKES
jgi:hypothetical protein